MTAPDLEENRVYVKPRGDVGYDIFWRQGPKVYRVYRKDEAVARAWAVDKQKKLDAGEVGDPELPFADTVVALDSGNGAAWLELLWAAALLVGMNPSNESAQAAGRCVAAIATAARKFISADQLGADSDVPEEEFWAQVGMAILPKLEQAGIEEEARKRVLTVLKGGKVA